MTISAFDPFNSQVPFDQDGTVKSEPPAVPEAAGALLSALGVTNMEDALHEIHLLQTLMNRRAAPSPDPTTNEGELFKSLSMALTGGNAATWDEVIHAVESRPDPTPALRALVERFEAEAKEAHEADNTATDPLERHSHAARAFAKIECAAQLKAALLRSPGEEP